MLVSRVLGSVAARSCSLLFRSSAPRRSDRSFSRRSDGSLFLSSRASVASRGISTVATLILSFFILLTGVLVTMPVQPALAAAPELGPDGYFSALTDVDGDGDILPVVDNETGTAGGELATGWANTRRILFGKQRDSTYPSTITYTNQQVSGGYKTLGYGGVNGITSVSNAWFDENGTDSRRSATTTVAANEALLWADNVVTSAVKFDTSGSARHSFDSATLSYQSNLAQISDGVGSANYSSFEQSLIRVAQVEGVCTAAQTTGCGSGSYTQQSHSENSYGVFPLSSGDIRQYFGHASGLSNDANLACPSNSCANSTSGSWLRSADWTDAKYALAVGPHGYPNYWTTNANDQGLRPAVRLSLDRLLLSADGSDQSQSSTGDLRLTFVQQGMQLTSWSASVSGGVGSRHLVLSGMSGFGGVQSGLGWKVVDPDTGVVLGSGSTSGGGNVALPESKMTDESKDYELYVWGQVDGSAIDGWTNMASEPVKTTIRGWKVKVPVSYGIEVSGMTSGGLKAYRIGEYDGVVFDQTGALSLVSLVTPDVLKSVVLAAARAAGGVNVDGDNPSGWVGWKWSGYPTDPLSEDSTSAYSPYAGKLQLFAQALAGNGDAALGGVQGSLPAGTFASGATAMLSVSGPGVYLIVDDSGASLPIVVGTKVLNEDLGDEGRLVDFVDAGVRGKPRLGVAGLKTEVAEVSKRIVNDAGMDGFDVGADVEFEVVLRVPDLSGFSAVTYDEYEYRLADEALGDVVLSDVSNVRVLMDAPVPDTDVTSTPGVIVDIDVDADRRVLDVIGLKALFAEDASGHVANTSGVPVGSLMRIRYTAVLGVNAVSSAPGGGGMRANMNTARLISSTSTGGEQSLEATAGVYTFRVDALKVDREDGSTPLSGAVFEVSRDGAVLDFVQLGDGRYRLAVAGDSAVVATVTSGVNGVLSLQGVEARALEFRELTAPSGYFPVPAFSVDMTPVWTPDAGVIELVSYRSSGTNLAYVSQDGRSLVVADPSYTLANLPYTGGVGILILLLAGGLFLAFAVRPYYLAHCAEATANILE
jgi:hypothetical protein